MSFESLLELIDFEKSVLRFKTSLFSPAFFQIPEEVVKPWFPDSIFSFGSSTMMLLLSPLVLEAQPAQFCTVEDSNRDLIVVEVIHKNQVSSSHILIISIEILAALNKSLAVA